MAGFVKRGIKMNIKVYAPVSLQEAVELFRQEGGKVLAGGTDLIIELRKEKLMLQYLLDLSYIAELKGITITDTEVVLGAMTTFSDIVSNEYIKQNIPALWECASKVGACQIQNRATIGGNICNAAAAADSIPVLLSLGAVCVIIGCSGERVLPIDEFVLGSSKNGLIKGELLKSIVFPKPAEYEYNSFSKLGKRNALAISTIVCAIRFKAEEGRISDIAVCTGSLGSKAARERGVEMYLTGKILPDIDIQKAADILSTEVEERLKTRASIVYKKHAVKGVFKEALEKCIESYGSSMR
ncbi:MAG: FAD binding domain-containing protein [Bacillota bacterium]